MKLAPIVLFAYNRPNHVWETLLHLVQNESSKDSVLFAFVDNSPVRERVIDAIESFREHFAGYIIIAEEKHLGCKKSIVRGMNYVFEIYDRAIVLEDDIVVGKDFLKFMNEGLECHKDREYVSSITGSCPPVRTSFHDTFIYPRFWSHGWATWKDRWEEINFKAKTFMPFEWGGDDQNSMMKKAIEGKIDSWAIYACNSFRNKVTVFPRVPKCMNIGYDGTGTNGKFQSKWKTEISNIPLQHGFLLADSEISEQIDKLFKQSWYRKLINRFL